MNTKPVCIAAAAAAAALASSPSPAAPPPDRPSSPATVGIGERPAIEHHVDQADVDAGALNLKTLRDYGEKLFVARFNRLDGEGRPGSTGGGAARVPVQPAFIRTSGPDSNSCVECHNQPAVGGAGGFVANVFVLAQELDPVTDSTSSAFSNERNTVGMFGAGPIEMLAREMSAELGAIREEAARSAQRTGRPVTLPLSAKGVSFGRITVLPDGRVDPTEIEGVDWDLVVKPFNQKGTVVSLREFSNNAMNHHHGMQSVERFGADVDADLDGVANEVTVGDMTAMTVFQASLPIPSVEMPLEPARRRAVSYGAWVFEAAGCGGCHVPEMHLESRFFTEPNPYNPPGNLAPAQVPAPFSWDMTSHGPAPRLQREGEGAVVRAFTDLKRHDLCDADYSFFCNEKVPQGKLTGFASPASFTVAPEPRPTREFLTRKLWDAGNTDPYGHRGELTTLTEAIHYHGGEGRASRDAFFALPESAQDAVIEFLKSLQVLTTTEGQGDAR
jgi:hypothetical protein